ncbi:anti-sigma factor antagonist [Streptomyces lincolnensis]|uniref:anti-sigma factor antagonist n=1 Tax=Streptomyces lincolnensis TaxID=1915 RepID=UPI0022B25FC6|nr:anti-sigma factor antagonist [Streptomyces lincolnensis]MCD7441163.1 anti-sigma factor antagonist [Streptomyces lincolnensis]
MSHPAVRPRDEESCTECGTAFRQSHTPVPLKLSVDTVGDRVVVTVSGELDLESDHVLYQSLNDALDHAEGGVDLDLAGVEFCDCSALNVLLRVRHRAVRTSKSLALRAASPAVERLLGLTSTRSLFTGSTDEEQADGAATAWSPSPPSERPPRTAGASDGNPAAEIAQLRRAMETRPAIDMARGILMASFQLTVQQSWQVLVAASQRSNVKLHLIAEAVLGTVDGQALPEPLAGHLAAAVKEAAVTDAAVTEVGTSGARETSGVPEGDGAPSH